MDLTNLKGGFIGTYLTRDKSKAIIVAKSKMVVVATGKVQEIWCGYVIPNPESPNGGSLSIQPGIWDDKGNFLDVNRNGWDLMNRISEKA